jgi:uncharacterized protein YkwD
MFLYNKEVMGIVTPLIHFGQTLLAALSLSQYGISVLDVIIAGVIVFYAFEGFKLGFTYAFMDLLSFVLSFLLGLTLYNMLGKRLIAWFSMPQGFANALGFFLIALISEIIVNLILRRFLLYAPHLPEKHPLSKWYEKVKHPLGIVPGLASAFILLSFLLTVVVALPSSPYLKQLVTTSRIGSAFIAHTAGFEHQLNDVFGGALDETLNVLTVKPESDETIPLHFTVKNPTVDESAEQTMLTLVNGERTSRGLSPLVLDAALQELARSYAKEMFQQGYFSHYDPEGRSPFDRMNEAGITYMNAGENLALAPSVDLAHQGLMNSPGHRANILSPNYQKVGIGVMDGGIYGKMFVQEFTN